MELPGRERRSSFAIVVFPTPNEPLIIRIMKGAQVDRSKNVSSNGPKYDRSYGRPLPHRVLGRQCKPKAILYPINHNLHTSRINYIGAFSRKGAQSITDRANTMSDIANKPILQAKLYAKSLPVQPTKVFRDIWRLMSHLIDWRL